MNSQKSAADRPWPRPAGPWLMAQTWHDVLFAHWPVPVAALQAHMPAGLTLDLFAGQAWVGIVAFRLSGIRLRGTPPLPGVSQFPEINVRTYVIRDGKPGVLFLSLDADNRLGIALARPWFLLPYFHARVAWAAGPAGIAFRADRDAPDAPPATFAAHYGPTGPAARARLGSLARWLTDRYCYYSADHRGRLARCEIDHAPWPLQPATADITANTFAAAHGLALPATPPLLHYAARMQAQIWPVRPLPAAAGQTIAAARRV